MRILCLVRCRREDHERSAAAAGAWSAAAAVAASGRADAGERGGEADDVPRRRLLVALRERGGGAGLAALELHVAAGRIVALAGDIGALAFGLALLGAPVVTSEWLRRLIVMSRVTLRLKFGIFFSTSGAKHKAPARASTAHTRTQPTAGIQWQRAPHRGSPPHPKTGASTKGYRRANKRHTGRVLGALGRTRFLNRPFVITSQNSDPRTQKFRM